MNERSEQHIQPLVQSLQAVGCDVQLLNLRLLQSE